MVKRLLPLERGGELREHFSVDKLESKWYPEVCGGYGFVSPLIFEN